jgi:pilus assembly protein CpaE
VILLALEEPPVRGLATLEALQQQQPDTPVLAYSASGDVKIMRQAMRLGARDFLAKPLNEHELRDAIHTVLTQEEQRQLARWSEPNQAPARGTVITVAGAKGGIGKTTLAANLAIAIRQLTGQTVALVDADTQFGDVAVMLDLDVQRSIADLVRSGSEINRLLMPEYVQRHDSGVDVLTTAAEPDDWRALGADHLTQIVRALSEIYEYVIVDTPGTMTEVVAASLTEASIILLLTSLDVSSVKDTKTALRILESWGVPSERIRLVLNDNTRATKVKPQEVEQACGMEAWQRIPHDQRVGVSVQTGLPMVLAQRKRKYSTAVGLMAASLAGVGSDVRLPRARVSVPRKGRVLFGGRI